MTFLSHHPALALYLITALGLLILFTSLPEHGAF